MFNGLRGKTVLITGATGGIGSAMVRLFASQGSRLGIHYRDNRRAAEGLEAEARRNGTEAHVFQGDLLEFRCCVRLVRSCIDHFGAIDILINNAGAVMGPAELTRLSEDAWDQTIALNAKAPFVLSREAFAHMKRRGGKIINISSIAVKYGGSPHTLHYAAAKAALEALTRGMARIGAPHRILVNAIRGGFIDTPFHRTMKRRGISERIRLIPLKRAGQPLDVARAALFLASEAGDFITGEILTVAGGD